MIGLVADAISQAIDEFFTDPNLTLPKGKAWRNVAANIFSAVDGKRILFEDADALFHLLQNRWPLVNIIPEQVAMQMTAEEIHEDVHDFMGKLLALVSDDH